jgi:hypothetical protein
MPTGSQQFDLPVYDSFQTKDPAAALVGTDIEGTVTVTINWNAAGTDLAPSGVVFSEAVWNAAGNGPLTVYDEAMGGGLQAIGTAAWSVSTSFSKTMKTDTPNKRYLWTVTPVVILTRKVTSTIGNPTVTEVAYTATDNVDGGWIPQP